MESSLYTPVKSEPTGYQTAPSNYVRYLTMDNYISKYPSIERAINDSIFVVLGAI